eukprot:scaffold166355_cov18-Tisochrysis_lutea.AAC.1
MAELGHKPPAAITACKPQQSVLWHDLHTLFLHHIIIHTHHTLGAAGGMESHKQHACGLCMPVQMREQEMVKLDEICREQKITLVAVRSYGLVGLLR